MSAAGQNTFLFVSALLHSLHTHCHNNSNGDFPSFVYSEARQVGVGYQVDLSSLSLSLSTIIAMISPENKLAD